MKNNVLIGITGITFIIFLLKNQICKKKNKKKKVKRINKSTNTQVNVESGEDNNSTSEENENNTMNTEIDTENENNLYYKELGTRINNFLLLQENGLIKSKKALTFFIKEGFSIKQIKQSYQAYGLYLDNDINIQNFIGILYSKSIFEFSNNFQRKIRFLY